MRKPQGFLDYCVPWLMPLLLISGAFLLGQVVHVELSVKPANGHNTEYLGYSKNKDEW